MERRCQRASSRPGFHQTDRETGGGVAGADATAGQHEKQLARHLEAAQRGLHAVEITRHDRLDIDIRHGGRGPLILADFGEHLGG